MYIGHFFGPLHCKFATFMANDNARSAIFCWLALCGLWEMQACGLHGGRFLPDFRCGRMDAGRPRVVWAAVPDWKMYCGALPDAARCVGRCSALYLLPRLSAPNLLPPCPPLSMGEKSPLHGSVTSSPRDRVDSCIVLWWLFCRRETHFPLGWKFSSISKSPILHGAASSSSYGRKTIGSQVFVASPAA